MNKTKVCIFDAYGTLFDVNAACRELSIEVGEKWQDLANLWRLRQVEYTWLRNSMNEYIDFWEITGNALEYAMDVLEIKNQELKDKLLALYYKLDAYPEVKNILKQLKKEGYQTGILSNGSSNMLSSAVQNADIQKYLDKVLSVETCKIYKPSNKVYELVGKNYDIEKNEVAFFSSNAWDMHAAANFGFKTIWINRFESKLEKLPGKPYAIVKSLDNIIEIIK